MQKHSHYPSLILAAAVASLTLAACSAKPDDAAAGQGAAKAASAPSEKSGVITAGMNIAVHSPTRVCTNTQHPGDHVDAIVADAVTGSEGAAIPAGATASVEIVESQYGQNDGDKVRLTLRVASVTFGGRTYDLAGADIVAPPVTKVRRQSTGAQVGKVATGAAIGAVVGKVVGKSNGATVAGGAVGAAAGGIVAKETADYDGCIAADAKLVAKLTQDVRVRVGT
jgi:hypothetical protein